MSTNRSNAVRSFPWPRDLRARARADADAPWGAPAITRALGSRRAGALVVLSLLTLSLAACGGGPATTASPAALRATSTAATSPAAPAAAATPGAAIGGSGDPCRYLTPADIQAALGAAVGDGKRVATLQDCIWTSADFSVSANLTFSSWDAINTAAHGGGASKPTAVSGIGDEAYTGVQGSLYVRKGDQGFLLLISSPAVQHATDNGVAIGKLLAARILAQM